MDILSKLAKSISNGRGVVGISLPVRIFEPRSLIERITELWSFAPCFLSQAAKITNPLKRFKLVLAFVFSGMHMSVSHQKPFNPILGETYEGYYKDGTKIYVEHVSHHPPICTYYIVNDNWTMNGSYRFKGGMSGNNLTFSYIGPNNIVFKDG